MMDFERSTSFVVDISDNPQQTSPKPKKIPQRLLQYSNSQKTKEELESLQKQADKRRKEHENAKIDRIKERSEECHKIDAKVQLLLAQDAKRKGLPGTEHIKPMSTRQVVTSIKSLSKDFSKLTSDISSCDMDTS